MGGIGRLVRIVILVAVALALVLTVALPPPSAAASAASPAPDIAVTEPAEPTSLGGRWRKLPRSPFGAVSPAAVWTGSRMVVVDPRSRRTATYDPVARRWKEHERAPGRFHPLSPVVWSGHEMIVLAGGEQVSAGYAFDPGRGRWRDIAPPPVSWIRAAVWTGEMVLVAVSGDDRAAAYDPGEDAWDPLPDIPVPTGPAWRRAYEPTWASEGLHWTGDLVLAVMEPDDGGLISIATLDPVTRTWALEPQGEMIWAFRSSSIWAAGRLWFVSYQANRFGVTNATYDPTTDTWEPYEGECLIGSRAIWTGRLFLAGGQHALDPATGECYRAPRSRDRHRAWPAEVWTGRELILWSGSRGETTPPQRDGIAYRPPLDAVERPPVAQQEGSDVRD